MQKPHVVILGAGYSGLKTATKLQKTLHRNEADITLINKYDYHYQTSCLHEAAAGTLGPDMTSIPIRNIINQEKINFLIDEVSMLKFEEKKVKLTRGDLSYDYLVIGLGFEAKTNSELSEHVFPIETLNNALLLREHLEYHLAKYANEEKKDPARLNIVITGGGFTGVEFAGELADRIPELCREYDVEKTQIRIIIVERESTILPDYELDLINYAMNSLKSRGVEFIMNAEIVETSKDYVVYEKDGEQVQLPTKTVVWTAGVCGNSLLEKSGIETKNGKVEVNGDMRIPGMDDVYVVGDCARIINPETGNSFPSNIETAINSAVIATENIKAQLRGQQPIHIQSNNRPMITSLGSLDGILMTKDGRKHFGWKAMFMKKLYYNWNLLRVGGINLLLKKGRFNIFGN